MPKTALQDLIEYCLGNSEKELLPNSVGNRDMISMEKFYKKAKELLEQEKNQIILAFDMGASTAIVYDGEEYFNTKFNTNQ